MDASQAHVRHASRDDVEARRDGDDVELVQRAVAREDALGLELNDGRLVDVDDVHVRAVELLVEVLLETRPLHAEGMRRLERSEEIAFAWVADAIADILGPEIIRASIRLCVKEHVLVIPKPVPKPTMIPELVVEGFLLFVAILEGVFLAPAEQEPAETPLAELVQTRIVFLGVLLFLGGQGLFAHGDSKVRGTLEYFQ